jgi:hypothetical protein
LEDGSSVYGVRNIWRDDVMDVVECSELVLIAVQIVSFHEIAAFKFCPI